MKGDVPKVNLAVVEVLRGDNGIVFYSQLSALWCMQAYVSTTRKNAMQRIIGTVIGVGVNLFRLPHKKNVDALFISGLDDTLLNKDYHINDYCKVELNRMIDEGLHLPFQP